MRGDVQAIVLDANQRSALAVTRSFGRSGVRTATGDKHEGALAQRSRYSYAAFRYPDPSQELSAFIAELAALGPFTEKPVLVACTDESLPVILAACAPLDASAATDDAATELANIVTEGAGNSAIFAKFALCVASAAAYGQLSDKWSLYGLASANGVPVPRTWRLAPRHRLLDDVAFGCAHVVVKPRQSVLEVHGVRRKLPVLQLARAQLAGLLAEDVFPAEADLLVQETVPGVGVGVSVMCNRGVPVAWFAHRRLREKPPSGGVSVLCESIALDPQLQRHCQALIEATAWHGPAMFEFKVDQAGNANLIEVNGRLWGSLQLAIDCGVDMPMLMYRLARGEAVPASSSYAVGRRLRWLVGDFSHLYLVLRGKGVSKTTPGRLRTLFNVLATFGTATGTEDWRYGDYRPFLHQLAAEFGR